MESLNLVLLASCAALVNCNMKGYVNVNTSVGVITGTEEHVQLYGQDYQLKIFRGIPYAEPPIGKRRFKRSVPKSPFANGYNATEYGDGCPQHFIPEFSGPLFPNFTTSEDCLFLNVYAPLAASASNLRPAMVFIHGGGWTLGASQQYDGAPMAAFGDVVLVTLNYRLGPLGYLDTGDTNAPGNNGLFDELLAIHWVKDNIEMFGGDPNVITVFGESAGGVETSLHAISPISAGEGLFTRAIPQSGAAVFPFQNHFAHVSNPLLKAKTLGSLLGCMTEDVSTMVECMQSKSTDEIIALGDTVGTGALGGMAWGPTVDGEFVPELPRNLFSTPTLASYAGFSNIDLMIGSNGADGDVGIGLINDSAISSQYMANGFIPTLVTDIPNGKDMERALVNEYVPSVDMDAKQVMFELVDMLTDLMFIGPAVSTALTHERMSQSSKTYMYFFDYLNPLTRSSYYSEKAGHGMELFLLFWLPSLEMKNRTDLFNMTTQDKQMSKAMMTYWTNFAKFGNPNGNVSEPTKAMNLTEFPEFSLHDQSYLHIGGSDLTSIQLTVKKNLRGKQMSFWLDYLPYIAEQQCPGKSTVAPEQCTSCPPLVDQQIGVLTITVGQAQTVFIVLAIATALFACLSVLLLYACCSTKKALKIMKKGNSYHSNKAFSHD